MDVTDTLEFSLNAFTEFAQFRIFSKKIAVLEPTLLCEIQRLYQCTTHRDTANREDR